MNKITLPLLVPNLEEAISFFHDIGLFEIDNLSIEGLNKRASVSYKSSQLSFFIDMHEPKIETEYQALKVALNDNSLYFMLDIEDFFEWHKRMLEKNT